MMKEVFSLPTFRLHLQKPVIGIISKADLGGDVEKAKEILEDAGAEETFVISSYSNEGISALYEYLDDETSS